MTLHVTAHRAGFDRGLTEITRIGEPEHDTGIGLAVLRLDAGARWVDTASGDTAWLLMDGRAHLEIAGQRAEVERRSIFEEGPSCVHASAGQSLAVEARTPVELMIFRTANRAEFPARIHLPREVRDEPRGRGALRNTAFRYVRTIFDRSSAPERSDLVLGEVVTFPGRWSSYPPHHHPQPEIYHYRFTDPAGFGHAELGEQVVKVRQYDTLKIPAGLDHPQCAAPGYGMYYAWVIRHLPGLPYDVPEFTEAHRWLLDNARAPWWPRTAAGDEE